MRMVLVRLPDNLFTRLKSEAKARKMTKSRLVRESLEKAFQRRSADWAVSCDDLASDLAGRLKGLPGDLAENPKFLEGFGR